MRLQEENSSLGGNPSSFSLVGWDKQVHFLGGTANDHQTEISNVVSLFSLRGAFFNRVYASSMDFISKFNQR